MKYISIFRLVLRCLLVARKENLTGFSTGLTGRSKNLDPTGNPTGWSTGPVPIDLTGFHLWRKSYSVSIFLWLKFAYSPVASTSRYYWSHWIACFYKAGLLQPVAYFVEELIGQFLLRDETQW